MNDTLTPAALIHYVVDGVLALVVFLLHRELKRVDAAERAVTALREEQVRQSERQKALENTHAATREEFSNMFGDIKQQLARILDRLEEKRP